jgi:hypothetical protein
MIAGEAKYMDGAGGIIGHTSTTWIRTDALTHKAMNVCAFVGRQSGL